MKKNALIVLLSVNNNSATKHQSDCKLLVWSLWKVTQFDESFMPTPHSFACETFLLKFSFYVSKKLYTIHTKQIPREFSWAIPLKPHSAVLSSDSPCLSDLSHDTSSLSSDPDQYPSCRATAHLVVTSCSVCTHTWAPSKSFIWSLSSSCSPQANITRLLLQRKTHQHIVQVIWHKIRGSDHDNR